MSRQPSPYGDHRRKATAPALRCSFCGRPRAEVNALVVAPSVAICDLCTMAAFLSLDESQRRHAIRCLHGIKDDREQTPHQDEAG